MSIFCYKKLIEKSRPVSEQIKQARESAGLTLEELSSRTQVPPNHLLALEEGRYGDLPRAKPYRLAYLRSYGKALGLDSGSLCRQFAIQNGLSDLPRESHPLTASRFKFFSMHGAVKTAAVFILVITFAGYLIWQIKGITEPPKLLIYSPSEGYISSELSVAVQGETEKECLIKINGQEMRPTDDGKFEARVDLSNGVNTITISAVKKHGKTATEVRHVMVRAKT